MSRLREVSGGSGYLSQDAPVASFGLGAAVTVDTLHVTWQYDGQLHHTFLTDVAVDQILVVQVSPVSAVGEESEDSVPVTFTLHPCFPNPFNPMTSIRFDLPQASRVSLGVYDVMGRLVRVLIREEPMAPGRWEVVWNGRDDSSRQVAAGTYFCRLEAGAFHQTRRMTLVK